MAKTRADALAVVFATASGRPEEEVSILLRSVILPQLKDPSRFRETISDEEFGRLCTIGQDEALGVLSWLIEGSKGPPIDPPQN